MQQHKDLIVIGFEYRVGRKEGVKSEDMTESFQFLCGQHFL